nr:hypothetical protein [Nanoarchaeum sp.]
MVYSEDIASCLKNYRDEIIPLLDQEEYKSAGRGLGKIIVELSGTYERSQNLKDPSSKDLVFGLIARLSSLQYFCLEDCPNREKIITLKELVQERSKLVISVR